MRLDDDWLEIDWNVEPRENFSRVRQLMEQVARARRRTGRQPDLVAVLVVTVHSLGGCPMGT
jgi:hypothetical protein